MTNWPYVSESKVSTNRRRALLPASPYPWRLRNKTQQLPPIKPASLTMRRRVGQSVEWPFCHGVGNHEKDIRKAGFDQAPEAVGCDGAGGHVDGLTALSCAGGLDPARLFLSLFEEMRGSPNKLSASTGRRSCVTTMPVWLLPQSRPLPTTIG